MTCKEPDGWHWTNPVLCFDCGGGYCLSCNRVCPTCHGINGLCLRDGSKSHVKLMYPDADASKRVD